MEKLVDIVQFLHFEIHNAFGSSGMYALLFKLCLSLPHLLFHVNLLYPMFGWRKREGGRVEESRGSGRWLKFPSLPLPPSKHTLR